MRLVLFHALALSVGPLTALTAAAQPDLAFESVVVTRETVKARVVNRGTGDAPGCHIDLRIFDSTTHRATGSRRRSLAPLGAGATVEIAFPYESDFEGHQLRFTVDSQNRVGETNEKNNVSEVVAAPAPLPRRPPTRVPGTTAPTPAPVDPAQPSVDLVAEAVRVQGGTVKATVRNVGNEDFTGHRKAILTREVADASAIAEPVSIAQRSIPNLAQGEEFVVEAPRPPLTKGARTYVYRLRLEPGDANPGNDAVLETVEVVPID